MSADPAAGDASGEGFALVPWRVIDAGVSPQALAVFCAIARHADRDGNAFPSMDRIAKVAGVCAPTARKSVRELCDAGLLSYTREKGANGIDRPHRYVVPSRRNQIAPRRNGVAREAQPDCAVEAQPRFDEPEPVRTRTNEPTARAAESARARGAATKFDPCSVPIPEALAGEEFRAAWLDWIAHRREIQKPMKPTQTRELLAELAGWGLARAVVAIKHSVAKGWQGIFEPSCPREQPTPHRPTEPTPLLTRPSNRRPQS